MKNSPTVIAVVAAALIDPQGRVLMQRRQLGKAHGGLWEFPGGKVEAGESAVQGLCRELAEELGLTVDPDETALLTSACSADSPVVLSLYICRRWQGRLQCLDAAELGWFLPDQLDDLAMPPLDVPLTKALCEVLKEAN